MQTIVTTVIRTARVPSDNPNTCTTGKVSRKWIKSALRKGIESEGIAVVIAELIGTVVERKESAQSVRRYKVLTEAEGIMREAFERYVRIKA